MKIVLATPIYPPEIAELAPYVKELAKQLSKNHKVTIVTYGCIPEKIEGVKIVTANKNQPLPIRLISYTLSLWKESKTADITLAQNGASVELPLVIISFLAHRPIILSIGDISAHERASRSLFLGLIEKFAVKRSKKIIYDMPKKRPIIYPFEERKEKEWNEYSSSWSEHLKNLEKIIKNE